MSDFHTRALELIAERLQSDRALRLYHTNAEYQARVRAWAENEAHLEQIERWESRRTSIEEWASNHLAIAWEIPTGPTPDWVARDDSREYRVEPPRPDRTPASMRSTLAAAGREAWEAFTRALPDHQRLEGWSCGIARFRESGLPILHFGLPGAAQTERRASWDEYKKSEGFKTDPRVKPCDWIAPELKETPPNTSTFYL